MIPRKEVGDKGRLGRRKGSPKSLRPEVKSLIASRAISERDITREQLAESLIEQIEASGHTAPTFETTIKYISKARSTGNDSLEKPWSTITVGTEMIDSEAIPWLIGAQIQRKRFLSKLLTIHQARWFNRLFGLRTIIKPLPEMVNNPKLELLFKSNMLVTWAEIYSYREKIESIAGIKKPDYNDLDAAVFQHESQSIHEYSGGLLRNQIIHIDHILSVANKYDTTLKQLSEQNSGMLSPLINVRYLETLSLFHSLGEPDMSSESINKYIYALKSIRYGIDKKLLVRLQELDYEKKINFFISLRQQCATGNYGYYEENHNYLILCRFLDSVTKESENK